jgi:hypothetical protein
LHLFTEFSLSSTGSFFNILLKKIKLTLKKMIPKSNKC